MSKISNSPFRTTPLLRSSPLRGEGWVRGCRDSKGFTLIEVLLAMAILAVIMTVIYMSFSTAGQNIEKAEAIRDETDLARALIARLSSDIANSYVKQGTVYIFDGKKEELQDQTIPQSDQKIRHDKIAMTTLTNWPKPDSKETELWEVGYFFKEKPEGRGYSLFRREKRELTKDVPPLEGGVEYEITDRVLSLQFRYSDDGARWTDEGWDRSRKKTPKAVEIVVTLDNGKVYTTKVDVGNS